MKTKLKIYSVLFLLMFLMPSLIAQETDDVFMVKPEKEYWFFLNVRMEKNKETKLYEYIIKPSGGLYYGDDEKFKKSLWGNKSALRLAIGPFWENSQAKSAQKVYSQLSKLKENTDVLNEITDDQVHWYYLKVKQLRAGYKLEPTAARVATGTANEFYDALKEGLFQEMLAIGPFNDFVEAEDSKAMYRAQEDYRSRR